MSKKFLIRVLKAFIISSVAVYTFINGPSLYAQAQYWFQNTKSTRTSELAAIKPIRLPLSDIAQQPLPNQATLTIEKLHVEVPILFGIPSDSKSIYDKLLDGVVHYSLTPKPGQGGSSMILCHSSLYPWQYSKYGAPCALLSKLAPGDEIVVRYSDGRTFRYAMTQSLVFDPLTGSDDKRVSEFEQSSKPAIFLITCYPTNTDKHRITIKAELEQ